MQDQLVNYKGSCHCGTVTFEIDAPKKLEVEECNCSLCSKAGFLHLILPLSQFRLLTGKDNLSTYTFNTGVAKHTFCKTCGIKPFYIPRSNPDGIDINVRCLDSLPLDLKVVEFDGQNWESNAYKVAHKSRLTE